jgi:hypothetical protein
LKTKFLLVFAIAFLSLFLLSLISFSPSPTNYFLPAIDSSEQGTGTIAQTAELASVTQPADPLQPIKPCFKHPIYLEHPNLDSMLYTANKSNTAFFASGECSDTTNKTSICAVDMISNYVNNECVKLSCYTTDVWKNVLVSNTTSSFAVNNNCKDDCGLPKCVWAKISYGVTVDKTRYTLLGKGITCPTAPTSYPASCDGFSFSLFGFDGLRQKPDESWEWSHCVWVKNTASANCSTSGSLNGCTPDDADSCSAEVTINTPSSQCIADLLAQEMANGHCTNVIWP